MPNYVDNKEFYSHMKRWNADLKEAEATNRPKPPMPEEIALILMLMVEKISQKSCWIRYTYRQDLKAAALLIAVRYLGKFDPEKSSSPFSYATSLINNAFLRELDRQKTHQYTKLRLLESMEIRTKSRNRDQERNSEFISDFECAREVKKERVNVTKAARVQREKVGCLNELNH